MISNQPMERTPTRYALRASAPLIGTVGMSKTFGQFTADLSWQDARSLSACDENCKALVFSISSSW